MKAMKATQTNDKVTPVKVAMKATQTNDKVTPAKVAMKAMKTDDKVTPAKVAKKAMKTDDKMTPVKVKATKTDDKVTAAKVATKAKLGVEQGDDVSMQAMKAKTPEEFWRIMKPMKPKLFKGKGQFCDCCPVQFGGGKTIDMQAKEQCDHCFDYFCVYHMPAVMHRCPQ